MGKFNGRIPKLTLEIVVDTVFEALVVVEGRARGGESVRGRVEDATAADDRKPLRRHLSRGRL